MSERYLRQSDIVDNERLAYKPVTVIGVGAVGRQMALQLTALGVKQLQLIDFDIVEEVNLSPQGFFDADLNQPKVVATAALCKTIDKTVKVKAVAKKFSEKMTVGPIVFCCVDSITTRKEIWAALKDRVQFFADSRMAAESMRILTVSKPEDSEYYPNTLFSEDESYQGSCTAKATIYCANVLAGIMVSLYSKFLRNIPVERDLTFNLLTLDFVVEDMSNAPVKAK